MEKWDLYTRHRELTGIEHIRVDKLPEGLFFLVVHVWIRNSKGEYLISQRAANRPTYPLMWECVGGAVLKGEESLQAAVREVKEEVGVDLPPEKGKLLFTKVRDTIGGRKFQDIADVWFFEYDGEIPLEKATTDEVAQSEWMDVEQIKKLYEQGLLVDTLDYFFSALGAETPDFSGVIGSTVSCRIDRPLGTRHPDRPDMVYPVNYGYAEGIMGGDGEAQDVYLLGVKEPVEAFTGTVIAVLHRYDDTEDKWIVAPEGETFSDGYILGEICFQEQYFCGKLCR